MTESVAPTLPMKDAPSTRAFYERLGFVCGHEAAAPDKFLIMIRGGVHLHFFELPGIDPDLSYSGCYIYTDDVDGMYMAFACTGVGRVDAITIKPWGTREFNFWDLNGNLIRIGQSMMGR